MQKNTKKLRFYQRALISGLFLSSFMVVFKSHALELNWSGVFQSEAHFVRNYSLDSSAAGQVTDATKAAAGGYYIPGGGERTAKFQTLSLRLRPVAVVNDNIYIKSEFWLGDPIYGFFGSGAPASSDARQYYSTQSRGSTITAQRLWAEYLSDLGTVQVGRIPLHWGLGVVWNSGDQLFDRYQSSGDSIRLVSKFGSFLFGLGAIKYGLGNNLGGNCTVSPTTGACTTTAIGGAGLSDYVITLKYDNTDEEFETGVQLIRRIAGSLQDANSGYLTSGLPSDGAQLTSGFAFNTWDIFVQKKFGRFKLGAEMPIATGQIGGIDYKALAMVVEGKWEASDTFDLGIKLGQVPGQTNIDSTSRPDRYRFFTLHPSYRPGLIMFNYQLANFAGPNSQNNVAVEGNDLQSPYDNPITNARYLSLGAALKTGKWNFHGGWMWATAIESAEAGKAFFNTWERRFVNNSTGQAQSKSLGWEMSYGLTYFWDEAFQFGADLGWFFPGDFYQFSNSGPFNVTAPVFAFVLKGGLTF